MDGDRDLPTEAKLKLGLKEKTGSSSQTELNAGGRVNGERMASDGQIERRWIILNSMPKRKRSLRPVGTLGALL